MHSDGHCVRSQQGGALKMTKQFITTLVFDKRWSALKLTDDDLRNLQNYLMQNPGAGDIIEGSGGLIKLRWSLPNTGKSSGIRVLYVVFS